MSYSCVMNEGDVQTLRIPSEFNPTFHVRLGGELFSRRNAA